MIGINFAQPAYLFLLIIIPILIWWYVKGVRNQQLTLPFPGLKWISTIKPSFRQRMVHLPFILRMVGVFFLIIAIARPQLSNRWRKVQTEGIDIVMAMDISSSMLALDFKPNRLEAAKDVAAEFIQGCPDDRIGLVVFSSECFTQCPLTTDHNVLLNLFSGVKSGMIEDGTAIGVGLSTAVNRLRFSAAKSKVVVLLTDGENNAGSIAPLTAAELAKKYSVRVYTIGIGTRGTAPYPVQSQFGIQYQNMPVSIDEPLLQQMAESTGGKYFRATNKEKLRDIYSEIDKLEKTKVEIQENARLHEDYVPFGLLALFLLALDGLLRLTWFRTLP
jgi:Ca-activated chloride channel family protein